MSSTRLEIRRHDDHEGVLRVSLVGEVDIAVTEALAFRLGEFEQVRRPVRLDLARLRFIDGAGIAALVSAVTRMRAAGCNVEVCRIVTPAVALAVSLTGMAPALWPDRGGAQASATVGPPPRCRSAEVVAIGSRRRHIEGRRGR
jgi:anti-anti-sigma factor